MRISDWSSDVCSSDLRSMSQSERAQGAQAHPQLLEEFGGAYSAPQASYVTSVGRKIAVQSGLANAPTDYTIMLLNSPVMNAFAIPGGYVYVTRQLLGLMNDEAELASVLRSEEHTSELQSLMRISYAVFFL